MKIQNVLLFFTLIVFGTFIFCGIPKPTFNVVTWNILGPNTQDAKNFFQNGYLRIDDVVKELNTTKPDIAALQEVDATTYKTLQQKLPKNFVLTQRQEKGPNGGTVLCINTDHFNVISQNSKSLPGTGKFPGAASWVTLESKATGAQYCVASVHISRTSHTSGQTDGEMQLKTLIAALPSHLPTIITGDFNTNAPEINSYTIHNSLNGFLNVSLPANIHTVDQGNLTIDHILFKNITPTSPTANHGATTLNTPIHNQIPSDHRWISATFNEIAPLLPAKALPALPIQAGQNFGVKNYYPDPTKAFQDLLSSPNADQIKDEMISLLDAKGHVDINTMKTIDPELSKAILNDPQALKVFNNFVKSVIQPEALKRKMNTLQNFKQLLFSVHADNIVNEATALLDARGHVNLHNMQTIDPKLKNDILQNKQSLDFFNDFVRQTIRPIKNNESPSMKFKHLLDSSYKNDIDTELRTLKALHPKGHVNMHDVKTIYPRLRSEILNDKPSLDEFNRYVRGL